MTGGRIVRRVAGFYEKDGQFAVPSKAAGDIVDTAARIVGQHTGRIAITGVQGARIPISDNPLGIERIRLGSENHTILLTDRGARGNPDNEHLRPANGFVAGETVTEVQRVSRKIACTRILVSTITSGAGSMIDEAIQVAVHEMGHSWGIQEHCAVGGCAMQAVAEPNAREMLVSGRPFCDNCAQDLELAGYQALAADLGAK